MNDIDALASLLLEESKRFLEKAKGAANGIEMHAYLHAALSVGFASLEAHVNSIVDEQVNRTDLSVHEAGFLLERKVVLKQGVFAISEILQMQRIDERLSLLLTRCSAKKIFDFTSETWSQLKEGIHLRNELTHPKNATDITVDKVTRSLTAITEVIDETYRGLYGRGLPSKGRGLQSTLEF